MIMIRAIKQYGISALLLIVAIFCLFNIGQNIQDAFTVITNSLALLLAVVYFVNFERDIIIKIKGFLLNIKWPFHGKSKKILNNLLNFIIEKRWDIISYLFIFLLLIITLGQFSYLERFINVSWINKYQVILTVLAILSGGLTFWNNRERVEKESEEEQSKEELAEQRRKEDFPDKYPIINKIPILRSLVKWMYKEGWGYILSLIIVIIFCIFLSIGQWSAIKGFWIDEWISLETARVYFSKNFPYFESGGHISYGFAYFFLLSIVDILSDNYLHAGRILNLLFISLTAPFLYLSIKKILKSKKIALLSVFIFLTSPTTIYLINEIRSYIFSVLLLSIISYFIFVYDKNYFIRIISTILLTTLLIDNHITNIYFIAILVLIILIEKVFFKKDLSIKKLIIIILSLFSLAILAYKGNPIDAIKFYLGKISGESLPGWAAYKESFTYPLKHLFDNVGNKIMFILSAVSCAVFIHRRRILIYLLIFISIFILPIALSGVPNSFRYAFVIFPIYATILAFGVNILYYQFQNKKLNIILMIVIISVSIYIPMQNNRENVPWAKTIDFGNSWNKVKDYITDDTLILVNYMGVQFNQYVHIDKIIYDKQEFYYYENSSRYGKKNIFNWKYAAPEGKHFILDTDYLNIKDLSLFTEENKKIIVLIRPWNSDLDQNSFNTLKNIGFKEYNLLMPIRLFIYELN